MASDDLFEYVQLLHAVLLDLNYWLNPYYFSSN